MKKNKETLTSSARDSGAHNSGEPIDENRRKALAKLSKLGVTGAAATISILATTRKSAASPL